MLLFGPRELKRRLSLTCDIRVLLIKYFILLFWLILYVCGYMGDLSVCLSINTKLFSSRTAVYCTIVAFRIDVHASCFKCKAQQELELVTELPSAKFKVE